MTVFVLATARGQFFALADCLLTREAKGDSPAPPRPYRTKRPFSTSGFVESGYCRKYQIIAPNFVVFWTGRLVDAKIAIKFLTENIDQFWFDINDKGGKTDPRALLIDHFGDQFTKYTSFAFVRYLTDGDKGYEIRMETIDLPFENVPGMEVLVAGSGSEVAKGTVDLLGGYEFGAASTPLDVVSHAFIRLFLHEHGTEDYAYFRAGGWIELIVFDGVQFTPKSTLINVVSQACDEDNQDSSLRLHYCAVSQYVKSELLVLNFDIVKFLAKKYLSGIEEIDDRELVVPYLIPPTYRAEGKYTISFESTLEDVLVSGDLEFLVLQLSDGHNYFELREPDRPFFDKDGNQLSLPKHTIDRLFHAVKLSPKSKE